VNLGQRAAVFLLLFYKSQISPFLPSACKYQPSCSMYAKEAVERFGVRKGLYLSVRRLLRCRPFAQGGFDPVPDA
jgi:putative membrane protein insertion efficiency factor